MWIACGAVGCTVSACLPVCLEAAVEVTIPASEEVSSMAVFLSANALYVLMLYVSDYIGSPIWIITGVFAASCVALLLCFAPKYKRKATEHAAHGAHEPRAVVNTAMDDGKKTVVSSVTTIVDVDVLPVVVALVVVFPTLLRTLVMYPTLRT
jgi:hypothetical protein